MVGAVGKDLAGLVQGVGVFVDDGVVAAIASKSSGYLEQGIDAAFGLHNPVGGSPAPSESKEFIIGQADGQLK